MYWSISASKDSTIYEVEKTQNAGIDSVLEISKDTTTNSVNNNTRILIQYDLAEISASIVAGTITSPKYYLKLYTTEASEIPLDYTLYAFPISQSWELGVGKRSNTPINTVGASWKYRNSLAQDTQWKTSSYVDGTTGSYREPGGATWYTGSAASQSFSYEGTDLKLDVTQIVESWLDNTIVNNGFIIKRSTSDEYDSGSYGSISFFSIDTHTIYPPRLEVLWSDVSYVTGSITTVTYQNSASYYTSSNTAYPPIVIPTVGATCVIVSASAVYTSASDTSVISELVYYSGSTETGSAEIYNASGTFDGNLYGYLKAIKLTGSYTNLIFQGRYEKNGAVTYYEQLTSIADGNITGSIDGYYSGSFAGNMSSSIFLGDYTGSHTLIYTGDLGTQSFSFNSSRQDVNYGITGSQYFYVTCSNNLSTIQPDDLKIVALKYRDKYKRNSKIKFRFHIREQFPDRIYQTGSNYLITDCLPSLSYYSVKDAASEDVIIEFSDYTKISCDSTSSYFNLWMDSLQPERYYEFVIKVDNGNNYIEYFDGYNFKIIQ